MTTFFVYDKETRGYTPADVLPPGVKIGRYGDHAFHAVEPYTVHAKPYGLDGNKPVLATVYGVSGEYLLVKLPECTKLYSGYEREWHTVRFDQTTEGWRFTRSVVKVMKVLTSVAKKAAVERRKVERNRAAAKAREGREGTCQICEGRQIVQPTGANKGTLVLHGYRRPGYGFTVGNCYGYHRLPFEVACDALTEWVEMLAAEKGRLEKALAELPERKTLTIKERGSKEKIEIAPEDPRWERAMAERKYDLERSIRSVGGEHDYQAGRLAAWVAA